MYRSVKTVLVIVAVLLAASGTAWAQESASIRGFVNDASSGEALPGANVVLRTDTAIARGAVSNQDGAYVMSGVTPGQYILTVSYVGYQRFIDTVHVDAGDTRRFTIAMEPVQQELEEVVVQGEVTEGAAAVTAGLQEISAADLQRVPTPDMSGDLATYLSAQPGIVSVGDRGGKLFIRGGEPSQNSVEFDGVPLHQPFHILGFYSAFPSNIVNQTEIYAGGYPSEFSGALSSVIQVHTRNGNKNSFEGEVALEPFVSSAQIEGPIVPGEVSFIGSYRRSILEQGAARYIDQPLPYNFSDGFGKIHARVSPDVRMSVTGLTTNDRGVIGTAEEGGTAPKEIKWSNQALGTRMVMVPRWIDATGQFEVSYSHLQSTQGNVGEEPDKRTSIKHYRLGADAEFPGENVTMYAGWEGDFLQPFSALGGTYQNISLARVWLNQTALYGAPEFHVGDVLDARVGVRAQFYRVRFDPFLEPRARLTLNLGRHQISAAGGLYQQELLGLSDRRDATNIFTAWTYIPKPHDEQDPRSADVRSGRLAKAWHGILGYRVRPMRELTISIEGYYKDLSNLFISEWTAFPRFTNRLQPASGRSFGFETRVEYQQGPFYGYLNYGYSNTVYAAEQEQIQLWYGQENLRFHPPHDRTHQLNLLASATIADFDFSLRWDFGTGRPFSRVFGFDGFVLIDDLEPVSEVESRRRVIYERPYNARLPAYHRLDVSVSRAFTLGPGTLTLKAAAINAYNRENIFYLDVFTRQRANQLPVLPTFGMKYSIP